MTSRHKLAAAIAVLALTGLAGCGGGDDDGSATESSAQTFAVDMEATDFAFSPSTVTAPPGAKVKVRLHNSGQAPHTFTATSVGVDTQVDAGKTAEVELTMPASGRLDFVCKLHESQGMTGHIEPQ